MTGALGAEVDTAAERDPATSQSAAAGSAPSGPRRRTTSRVAAPAVTTNAVLSAAIRTPRTPRSGRSRTREPHRIPPARGCEWLPGARAERGSRPPAPKPAPAPHRSAIGGNWLRDSARPVGRGGLASTRRRVPLTRAAPSACVGAGGPRRSSGSSTCPRSSAALSRAPTSAMRPASATSARSYMPEAIRLVLMHAFPDDEAAPDLVRAARSSSHRFA